ALGVLGSLMSKGWLETAIGTGAPGFVQNSFTHYAGALLQTYQAKLMGGMNQQQAMAAAYQTANEFAEANRNEWMSSALLPGIEAANGLDSVEGTEFASALDNTNSKPIISGAQAIDSSKLINAQAMYDFEGVVAPYFVELLGVSN